MPRPKSTSARERLLETTAALALDEGLAAVNVDEISRRSGVAKTTLYRHFGSKHELLIAALDQLIEPPIAPDTGALLGDLRAFLESVRPIFADRSIRTLSLEIYAAATRDDELDRLRDAFFGGRMAPLLSVVDRAMRRGELSGPLDPADAIEAIEGTYIARSLIAPETIESLDLDRLAARVRDRLVDLAPPARSDDRADRDIQH